MPAVNRNMSIGEKRNNNSPQGNGPLGKIATKLILPIKGYQQIFGGCSINLVGEPKRNPRPVSSAAPGENSENVGKISTKLKISRKGYQKLFGGCSVDVLGEPKRRRETFEESLRRRVREKFTLYLEYKAAQTQSQEEETENTDSVVGSEKRSPLGYTPPSDYSPPSTASQSEGDYAEEPRQGIKNNEFYHLIDFETCPFSKSKNCTKKCTEHCA